MSPSSPLEVEEFDAVGEDQEEEENPANVGEHNRNEEIMIIPQVIFKESFHRHWFSYARELQLCCPVAYQSREDAVDCPGNWRGPVVPPPPDWDKLQEHAYIVFH